MMWLLNKKKSVLKNKPIEDISIQVSGSSVRIENGKIYINGNLYRDIQAEGKELVCVTINGNVGEIKTDCDVSCSNVKGNIQAHGDIHCHDVAGNVRSNGDVQCDNVDGNVVAGGDVQCSFVKKAMNTKNLLV